jgi:hypothetical protein
MLKISVFIFLLLSAGGAYAQTDECRVLKPEIAGTYNGDCKKGLAQGKGIAQGIDHYEGQFSKGLPSGRGTYKWANGVYYEGEWKNGMREGEGKMVYPDSVVTGFWKEDKYVGKKKIAAYRIITSTSLSRYTISKSAAKSNTVKIRIMQGGTDNVAVEDFSMFFDSGSEFRSSNYYGIENISYPVTIKVKYRAWNQLKTSQYDVRFEIEIAEPGSWDVVLIN